MTVEEQNKAVVRQYVDAFNRGDLDALRSLLTEDAEIQSVMGHGIFELIEPGWRQLIEGYGMQLHIEDIVAEGNLVSVRYTETGTFKARAFGHPPTGKSYTLVAMELFEVRNGKIARRWGARDSASQARQLGIPLSQ